MAVSYDDSILGTIRKLIGGEENGDAFDKDLIVNINSSFNILQQLGVGPVEGFAIEDEDAKWSDFVGENRFNLVREYLYLRARLIFDPPVGSVLTAIQEQIKEDEWRLREEQEVIW